MRGRIVAMVPVLLLALVGCADLKMADAGLGGPMPGVDASPEIRPSWTSCADVTAGQTEPYASADAHVLPRLSADFHPVAVVHCRTAIEKRSDGGSDNVAIEDRAEDVTALVAALRLPDEPAPAAGTPCPAIAIIPPYLALLDGQGRWVRPGVPLSACNLPRPEVLTAVEELRTRRVSAQVLGEAESAEAARTGCPQAHADMVWTTATYNGGAGEPGPLPAGDDVTVCVYEVTPAERGSGKPRGDFIFSHELTGERWRQVKAALAEATLKKATACTTPATRFALLNPTQATVHVELDGCHRVLLPSTGGPDALRQGTEQLGRLLTEN